MAIHPVTAADQQPMVPLIAQFRAALHSYRGFAAEEDFAGAAAEFEDYLHRGYPMFAWEENGLFVGFLVCRVDAPTVWVESLFVLPEHRRRGIAAALFDQAEALAASYGESMVYNYIHPNNHGVICFLESRGYTVLNLLEIRKPWPGETPAAKVSVDGHLFDY